MRAERDDVSDAEIALIDKDLCLRHTLCIDHYHKGQNNEDI